MINTLSGTISATGEKAITLTVGGIGFAVSVPNPANYILQSTQSLFTYMHWNQENGPSLFGFATELERSVFLMIIDCPKIGPSIALTILSQMPVGTFLEIITAGNHQALTKVNGIGSKKAEQIVVELKHKVHKLLSNGSIVIEEQQSLVQWQQLTEVLISLNYTKQEASKTVQHLAEKYTGQSYQIDQLIRFALAHLSSKQL